ncbi:unnamed protein product [Diatraea saccharalis]|uniref:Uncharacterized protein n=1 Tax=Diatraea saccharalis TaxID=40085 RepID=A0A9N9N1L9_9NEOP|nr:unnamed protein product [Diatraea saccharalis]
MPAPCEPCKDSCKDGAAACKDNCTCEANCSDCSTKQGTKPNEKLTHSLKAIYYRVSYETVEEYYSDKEYDTEGYGKAGLKDLGDTGAERGTTTAAASPRVHFETVAKILTINSNHLKENEIIYSDTT